MDDKFEFFTEENLLHNEFPIMFEVSGTEFSSVEQFIQSSKARIFGDKEMYKKMLAEHRPKELIDLGKHVKNFSEVSWNSALKEIAYIATLEKFQKSYMKDILLSTENKELVALGQYDTVWGIGLGENDADRFDKTKWKGTNFMGEILMRVRKELKRSHNELS